MNGEGDFENLDSPILPSKDPVPAEGKIEYDGHYSKAAIAKREELRRRGLTILSGGEDKHPYHPSRKTGPINPSTGTLKVVPGSLLKRQV
jgi:hypothetical protein